MICAKNYEKLSKFVKVTAKILSVRSLSRHGVDVTRLMRCAALTRLTRIFLET